METNYLLIKFERDDGQTLEMGVGCPLKVVTISGIESPEYTIHTASSATEDGEIVTGKKVDKRNIGITFGVDDHENREMHREKLTRFFNPKKSFILKLNWCYRQAQIECELQDFGFTEIRSMWDILEGRVDLLCPYPYFSDLDNFGKNIAAITSQWSWPLAFSNTRSNHTEQGKIYGYKTFSQEVNLENKGDVPTGIVIKFTATRGPVKNPSITKVSTEEFLKVYVDMARGDEIVIDTNKGKKFVTHNGVRISQKLDKLSTYFAIEEKDNNLRYDADEDYTNLDVTLYYASKWLGI